MSKVNNEESENKTLVDYLLAIGKGVDSRGKYAEKRIKDVVEEVKKGDIYWISDPNEPLPEAYYTVVQNHTLDEEAKALRRIKEELEGVDKNIGKVDSQELLILRLYEKTSNEHIDVKDISSYDLKKISKCSNAINRLGKAADIIDKAITAGKWYSLQKEGKTQEADKLVRDTLWKSATGWVFTQVSIYALATLSITNPILAISMFMVAGTVGDWAGENISDLLDEIFGLYNDAGAYTYPVDPLIFDLNGNGIETISVKDGVNFDFDKNGFAEKISWVGADDGLLVRDLDGNGKIESGRELMGDLTELADGTSASNGFEALRSFDINEDGLIDKLDSIYEELRIWQDKNQNGVVDEGELYSLEKAGIASINLEYENIAETDENGNAHTQKGSYTRTDGTTATVEDVWFAKDAADTVLNIESGEYTYMEETEEISKLPDIEGKGNQYSLHQAMLRDTTGRLQQLVESYVAEEDLTVRKSMIPEIVYLWTGVQDVEVSSRGGNISDARKLEALEVITGREFNSAYGSNPVQQAGVYLEQAFDKLVDLYYGQLEMQTTYVADYAELYMNFDVDDNGDMIFDITSVAQRYMKEYEEDSTTGKTKIFELVNNLRLTGMDAAIGKEKIYEAFPVTNSDLYHAADFYGNDTITGTNGDDILIGEGGKDILQGSYGDDTYIFNLGDGEDTIQEYYGTDRIVFGEGIKAEDIFVSREDKDLYLTNKTSGDRVKVENFFYDSRYFVETVEYADGTKWDLDEIKDRARYYYGTDGEDVISASDSYYYGPSREDNIIYAGAGKDTVYGNNGDDTLYGEAGEDTLNGGNGNDTLNGGVGNDILQGSYGDDTYIFNLGDGEDTIQEYYGTDQIVFGEGIKAEDIKFTRSGNNLLISVLETGDSIQVSNQFRWDSDRVETIRTSDGSFIDYTKLDLMIQAMASFEDTTGMMWEDAVENKNETATDLLNQWWVKETI